MIVRSMKLLSAGIICLAVASITIASCDSNSTSPGDPASKGKNNSGKGRELLSDDCNTIAQVSRCATGEAKLERSEDDPSLVVATGFNDGSGISSSFAPGNFWTQEMDVDFPEAGGNLVYTSSEAGAVQSTLSVTQSADDPNALVLSPTFSGSDDPMYDLQVWNNGDLVFERTRIPFTITTTVYNSECCAMLHNIIFNVLPRDGRCEWVLSTREHLNTALGACCNVRVVLNGEIINGTRVRLIERNNGGGYPYHFSDQVDVTGNVASYAIRAEMAGN